MINRLLPLMFLCACTTTQVLSPVAVASGIPNKGVYGIAQFGDSDPVKIKGKQPSAYPIHGIDVSRHNQGVNWSRAAKNGISFAFIKATEGKDDGDRRFTEFWQAAKRANMPRSAYHFYYFCAPAKAQAANYIRRVPKNDSSLPPVLDVEWNPKSPTCTMRAPRKEVLRVLKTWLKTIERHYGQRPVIYTTVDFYADNFSDGALKDYPFWLRSVTAQPKYKYAGRDWVFWQYSGTGRVPGIEGDVDLNLFNGSVSDWKRWMKKNRR